MTFTPGLYDDLQKRGLIGQCTSEDLKYRLDQKPITVYCGFDPTSDSLHIGSLLPLLVLRRFQKAGHRVIALVGGATGMIGDPSFKSQERKLLTPEEIAKNQIGITQVIQKFLDMSGPNPARIVNNYAWFQGMGFIEFLRDVGKYFTVNHMIAKESVKRRLEDRDHGISYTEFSYMLLQAYDFAHLFNTEQCELQIGGNDQWGNITAGTDLIRKMKGYSDHEHHAYGLTFPLITKADGTKFGKTESGTLWLNPEKTSPYQLYQYFIQTSDSDVMKFLRYFTFLDHSEYETLEQELKNAPEKRIAQKKLADEVIRIVHGQKALESVQQATAALFSTDIKKLKRSELEDIFQGAPSAVKNRERLQKGFLLVDALVETELCPSKGAARKEIQGGGVYVNNERISDVSLILNETHLIANEFIVLRRGKKNYALLRFLV